MFLKVFTVQQFTHCDDKEFQSYKPCCEYDATVIVTNVLIRHNFIKNLAIVEIAEMAAQYCTIWIFAVECEISLFNAFSLNSLWEYQNKWWYCQEVDSLGYIFVFGNMGIISSTIITELAHKAYRIRENDAKYRPFRRSRSLKVINFGTN